MGIFTKGGLLLSFYNWISDMWQHLNCNAWGNMQQGAAKADMLYSSAMYHTALHVITSQMLAVRIKWPVTKMAHMTRTCDHAQPPRGGIWFFPSISRLQMTFPINTLLMTRQSQGALCWHTERLCPRQSRKLIPCNCKYFYYNSTLHLKCLLISIELCIAGIWVFNVMVCFNADS